MADDDEPYRTASPSGRVSEWEHSPPQALGDDPRSWRSSPQLDEPLRSRERAALDIAVKALRSVMRRTNSEPSEDWDSTLLNIGMIECDCRDAMSDIAAALVPDAVK